MPSNRGRKQNNNLPPNRARDNQRAFRARRAAYLKALEQRIDELEEENKNYRKALDLPSPSRPSLGRGPTGRNEPDHSQPEHESRCQTVSPSPESAGSPSSCHSSPDLGSSLIAPSMSSHAMTMDVGPLHQMVIVNEHHTALSQGHQIRQSPYLAPKTPTPSNRSDRILTQSQSPPIMVCSQRNLTTYPSISEDSIESNFYAREHRRGEARNEVQHNFYGPSSNYPGSGQYQHTPAGMRPESYHDPNLSQRDWNPLLSNPVHTFRDQIFLERHQFPRPPRPEQAHLSQPIQHSDYSQPGLSGPQPHRDAYR